MKLPYDEFRFLTEEELEGFNLEKDVGQDKDRGFFIEADLEYPDEIHDAHNNLPLGLLNISILWGNFFVWDFVSFSARNQEDILWRSVCLQ